MESDRLSVATELKFFALIALTLTVLSGVYPLQFRGVNGDKDAGTGSDKPIPNLCTFLYYSPSFSKTFNLAMIPNSKTNFMPQRLGITSIFYGRSLRFKVFRSVF